MYSKRKYSDRGDGHEPAPKRQQYTSPAPLYTATPTLGMVYGAPSPYGVSYTGQPPPFPVVRLRGLPFDCSDADIIEFFQGLDLIDILFTHKSGRFTGEAFVVLAYPLQVDYALQKNRQNIGRRYIEVFRCSRQEYYTAVSHEIMGGSSRHGSPPPPRRSAPRVNKINDEAKESMEHTGVLRMRGLPYSAGKDDVMDFFKEFGLTEDRIHIVLNADGRSSGEAYVEFKTAEDSKSAMKNDRMTVGSRYIELFPSNHTEMEESISREKRE